MKYNRKRKMQRWVAGIMCACMVLTGSSVTSLAAGTVSDTGECEHHTHNAECGYASTGVCNYHCDECDSEDTNKKGSRSNNADSNTSDTAGAGGTGDNSGIATVAEGDNVKTFSMSGGGITYTISIDYSSCEGVTESDFSGVEFVAGRGTLPDGLSKLENYCAAQGYTYAGYLFIDPNLNNVDAATKLALASASVTITVTDDNGSALSYQSSALGSGSTLLGAYYDTLDKDIDSSKTITVTSSENADGGGYKSVTLQGKYSDMPLGSSGHLAIMSANSSAELMTKDEMEKNGVWLYDKDQANAGDGTWTVYDGDPENSPEDNARVKAMVSFSENAKIPNGYCMYIREIEDDSTNRFPDKKTVESTEGVGETNDYQVYSIHWAQKTTQKDDKGNELYNLNPPSVLGQGVKATIAMEYLKKTDDTVVLNGMAGERKLMVFNLNTKDKTLQDISAKVTNVTVNGNSNTNSTCYTGFTFETEAAGPYVFVSKKLPHYYIENLHIDSVKDGTGPWDTNNNAGNDSGESNGIVRSYDTIEYKLQFKLTQRESHIADEEVELYFEAEIKQPITSVQFNPASMSILEDGKYKIEYLNNKGEVLFYQERKDGKDIYITADGKSTSLNQLLTDSTKGSDSYKVKDDEDENKVIAKQRLTGTVTFKATNGQVLASGTRDFPVSLKVLNADNRTEIKPAFKVWVEGNDENYGSEGTVGGVVNPARPQDNEEVTPEQPVTVSSAPTFNLALLKNNDCSYKGWFDFSTGDAVDSEDQKQLEKLAKIEANYGKSNPSEFVDEDGKVLDEETQKKYANYRYGRISGYGVTLQLCTAVDNEDNRASKGMKGQALPVGDITFDLNFASSINKDATTKIDEYTPILWDYNENIDQWDKDRIGYYDDPYIGENGKVTIKQSHKGNGGRTIYWNQEYRTSYGKGAAPFNYKFAQNGCYYGGDWTLVKNDGNDEELANVASPSKVTGNAEGTTYHFKVNGYDFDFDNYAFPTEHAGNTGEISEYKTYQKCFSAGYIQVLSVMPRTQKDAVVDLHLKTTVNNLKLTTRDGRTLEAGLNDETKYGHEINVKQDNFLDDKIDLYRPGGPTKGNSFNGKYGTDNNKRPTEVGNGYLGTSYWGTAYDCNTYAGNDIYLMGYGMINPGSDFRLRQMNLLQLFDSRALSIRTKDEPGITINQATAPGDTPSENVTFLYAADPTYSEGYDTNKEGVLKHMNNVREENLVYSDRLNDDGTITVTIDGEKKNLTCIGVLAEVRGADIMSGKYQTICIPVHVNGEDETLVNKTVATVNTVRIWSDPDALKKSDGSYVSWIDGEWKNGANTLEGYQKPDRKLTESGEYSWELANDGKYQKPYVKTEYEDGKFVEGTHAGGVNSGNSLLLLNYKANINLQVANGHKNGNVQTFAPGSNSDENSVKYKLFNIEAKADAAQTSADQNTHLTIKTVLDEDEETGKSLGRISYLKGSAAMEGVYEVDNEGNLMGEPKSITLSIDKDHPTKIGFMGSDGKAHVINVYVISAADGSYFTVEIGDAPIGIQMPDITFEAPFAAISKLKDGDSIRSATYISGTGDHRAYDQTKGNTDNQTVKVSKSSGSYIAKSVSTKVIDLDGDFTYQVQYVNSSGTSGIDKLYLYDLLPSIGDADGSAIADGGSVGLSDFGVELTGGETNEKLKVTVYYSTELYKDIAGEVEGFGASGDSNVSGNEAVIEEMLTGQDSKFKVLGTLDSEGSFTYDNNVMENGAVKKDILSKTTCVYLRVEHMAAQQTLELNLTVKPNAGEAGDKYNNKAFCWDTTTALTSNLVETTTISRSISGQVWYDYNANGVYDSDEEKEKLLSGVECVLFRKNESGSYTKVTQDIMGAGLKTVTTTDNGAYRFDKLPAGEYVVAFKNAENSTALNDYSGATSYQINGENDETSSDGVTADKFNGLNGYAYAVAYNLTKEGVAKEIQLHTVKEIMNKSIVLENACVEHLSHQDLGLVKKGNLSIEKKITGDDANMDDSNNADKFTFNVTASLSGKELNGTYTTSVKAASSTNGLLATIGAFFKGLVGLNDDDSTTGKIIFENGKATVTVQAGHVLTIEGLPAGAVCSVTEDTTKSPAGYELKESTGNTDVIIVENETQATEFTNEYKPAAAEFTPKASKTVTGSAPISAQKFMFKLEAVGELAESVLSEAKTKELTVTAGTTTATPVSFDKLTFPKVGEYTFKISEVEADPVPTGYTYDKSKWTLTVKVKKSDNGGSLVATGTYEKQKSGILSLFDDTEESNTDAAKFKNNYQPTETTFTPQVKKSVKGAARPGDAEFTFTLAKKADEKYEGVTMPSKDTATVIVHKSENDNPASFGQIKFEKAGIYKFAITENRKKDDSENPGYQYDESKWTLTVTVEDKGGELKATGSYAKDDGSVTSTENAQFTNNYQVQETSYTPVVTKQFSTGSQNRPEGKEKTFSFTLSLADEEKGDGVTMPTDEGLTAKVTGTGTSDEEDNQAFGAITFTKAGEYDFTIRETEGSDTGYQYDTKAWNLHVKVEDKSGKLEVTEHEYTRDTEESTESATYTNTYKPTETTYAPQVLKTLTGTDAQKDFTFKLTADEDYGEDAKLPTDTSAKATVKNGSGSASFGEITFTKAGTYSFTIKEEGTDSDGYHYDTSEWTLKVTVTDETGTLTTKAEYSKNGEVVEDAASAAFENTYTAEAKLNLTGVKKMEGREFQSGDKFTFNIVGTSSDGTAVPMPKNDKKEVVNSVTINPTSGNSEKFTFGTIHFDQSHVGKTYTYTVTESFTDPGGVRCEEKVKTLTVYVKDNENGTLTLQKSEEGDAFTGNSVNLEWTNTYSTSGETSLAVVKTITGREFKEGDEFTFTIEGQERQSNGTLSGFAPMPAETSVTVKPETGSQVKVNFGTIRYSSEDKGKTYVYTIKEEKAGVTENGLTYDGTAKTVTVTVTDPDKHNGHLAINADYGKDADGNALAQATFTNSYQAAETEYEPVFTKKMTGDERPGDAEFTFELSKMPGASEKAYEGVTLPKDASVTVSKGSDKAEGQFEPIHFTKAGIYQFLMTEQDSKKDGYNYDPAQWILTVPVTDDMNGKLHIGDVTYQLDETSVTDKEGGAVFTNDYKVKTTGSTPRVMKKFTDNGQTRPTKQNFQFTLTPEPGNPAGGAVYPDGTVLDEKMVDTVTVIDKGTSSFREITYKKAGIYKFRIQEVTTGLPSGYEGDTRQWIYTVEVTDEDSKLTATETYTVEGGKDTGDAASAEFVNTYKPTKTIYEPQVFKNLTGTNVKKEFTFTITADEKNPDGAELPENKTAVAIVENGSGSASFGKITFTKAGIYSFTIKEDGTDGGGYTYDKNEWTLKVTVTDKDGKLIAEAVYSKDGEEVTGAAGATFENAYKAKADLELTGVKKMSGRNFQNGDEYTFSVTGTSSDGSEAPMSQDKDGKTVNSVTINPTSGNSEKFTFGTIHFDQTHAGKTYTYTVTESFKDPGGVSCAEKVKTLIVYVQDNEDGTLTLKQDSGDGGAFTDTANLEWTNRYSTSGATSLAVVKSITGREFKEGDAFTFTIEGQERLSDGTLSGKAPLPRYTSVTVKPENGSQIAVDFGTITYGSNDAGKTYVYTIKEAKAGETKNGLTYDRTVKTVTVTVTDPGHRGVLAINADYGKDADGNALTQATFTNSYQAAPTEYAPVFTKKMAGDKRPGDAEFTFELSKMPGASEKAYEGVTLPKDASVTVSKGSDKAEGQFEPIHFTKAGIYQFLMTEKDTKTAGYTYDTKQWILTVKVTDDLDGSLVCDVDYGTDADGNELTEAVFTNKYEKPEVPPDAPPADTPPSDTPSGDTPSENTPSANTVQTGDNNHPLMWMLFALLALLYIVSVVLYDRKRKKNR